MSPKKVWIEIDTLRGLAVVLMILNHAGVGWLDLWTGNVVADRMVLLGSYAPVLFFFVTGVGYGVSHDPAKARRPNVDVAYKAALLLVADMFWRGDGLLAVGLDFLGFIGLSMVVLQACCSGPRARAAAWAILIGSLAIRFGLGPIVRDAAPVDSWIQPLLGNTAMPGFSYWVTPWLAYPALGYLFGDAIRTLDAKSGARGKLIASLSTLGAVTGLAVIVLAANGFVFLRFGAMSFAFFVSSITVLAAACALAWITCAPGRSAGIGAALALRGVSSFVVVPIHMALIVLVGHSVPLPLAGWIYVVGMAPFEVLNYWLARRADREAQRLGTRTPVGSSAWIAVAIVLAASAVAVTLLDPGFVKIVVGTTAQLLAAVLLTVRPPRPVAD